MTQVDTSPSNFIRNILDEDLQTGKHQSIQTRFPPEPNGYLHIGHAKSICLNFGIANDYANAACNLRFDDTNPVKEDVDFVHAIQKDVSWLGFKWQGEVRYSSNYFDQLYAFAVELIETGKAYVCELNAEQTREYRGNLTSPGKDSPFRNRSIADNLDLFTRMRAGEFEEGSMMLRAKIDMASPNMKMRDPVIYRIRFAHHHQTADKWCIYPMYDFTHCISDAIEGITHSLCTLEFEDHRPLYNWVLENISIEAKPRQIEFSRLNLQYTLTSKRKLKALIDENIVTGWDDPRMPTISGMRRRGYPAASLREFSKRIGVTKQENTVELASLEACVREDLEANGPRAMAVLDPIKVIITNYDEDKSEQLIAPCHPKDESMGTRTLPFSRELYIDRADFKEVGNKQYKRLKLNKEVRLRNAYVIRADDFKTDEAGNITEVHCTYDADTLGKNPEDGRKVKGVIHWVDAKINKPAEFRIYDRLFLVDNPAAEENIHTALNPESLVVQKGFVEINLVEAVAEKAYQFEREGYFCTDSKDSTVDNLVFNRTAALRATF
ncbi:glutamine--tRNA ligase [Psychromonas sp. Urea-02u-13]|uniref:glutamine--tRNA ligase n=1 Tax=Psychromonas sp. Urea-02u-13 TaxID=2058326 RepID=UPI000C31E27D|nr:glutamine--tRNA ligase [Psychromonas sp. Urea-02u-13]PKG40625.1 glutamine--tRNA ligase [Psychromonas sp. Urea-02u-13]